MQTRHFNSIKTFPYIPLKTSENIAYAGNHANQIKKFSGQNIFLNTLFYETVGGDVSPQKGRMILRNNKQCQGLDGSGEGWGVKSSSKGAWSI